MTDSDNTINDDGIPDHSVQWDNLQFESESASKLLDEELPPVETHEEYDDPEAGLLSEKRRKPNSVKYEKQVSDVFRFALPMLIQTGKPAAMADSAAILMYAPNFSRTWGDLAAENKKVAAAIDFVNGGTENATAAAVMATLPLVLQLLRNHEGQAIAEATPYRELRIPLTKRTFKVRIRLPKLNRRLRGYTSDPNVLADHVFNNPEIVAALRKRGFMA